MKLSIVSRYNVTCHMHVINLAPDAVRVTVTDFLVVPTEGQDVIIS